MADPIITDHYRVQVVFQGKSGLPEDVFINNFVFRNDGLPNAAVMADTVETMLQAFYTGTPSAVTTPISQYLAWDGISGVTMRQYDLGQAPPRLPTVRENLLSVGIQNGDTLPREVAACLSYESEKRGPRGRGRIFLGPLSTQGMTSSDGVTRVSQPFRQAVADRALDLVNSTENATWVLLSPTDGDTSRIVGGYVDNAFDTQRSRGAAPSTRTFWGSYRGVNYSL